MAAGLLADRLLGEVRRFHPLVGFGRWAHAVEGATRRRVGEHRGAGVLAWALAVLPWVALALTLRAVHPLAHWPIDIALLYFALGGRSLAEHAEAVAAPLDAGDLDTARVRVSWIVSRDTDALDAAGVARAGTESVLENGNDAVFGALFWFMLGGGGVITGLSRIIGGGGEGDRSRSGRTAACIPWAMGKPTGKTGIDSRSVSQYKRL